MPRNPSGKPGGTKELPPVGGEQLQEAVNIDRRQSVEQGGDDFPVAARCHGQAFPSCAVAATGVSKAVATATSSYAAISASSASAWARTASTPSRPSWRRSGVFSAASAVSIAAAAYIGSPAWLSCIPWAKSRVPETMSR